MLRINPGFELLATRGGCYRLGCHLDCREFALGDAFGARLWSLQSELFAINPCLSKEILAAIAMKHEHCAVLRLSFNSRRLEHRARLAVLVLHLEHDIGRIGHDG